jgi:hypothetical protein
MIELEEKIWNELQKNSILEFENSKLFEVDELLNQTFEKGNGIVYQFYVENGEKYDLKYIGKSTGKYFKTRLKAHFKNIGKGTQSKFQKISFEEKAKRKVLVKYIETKPIYLRNLIEEMLINYYKKEIQIWNYKN